MQKDSSSYSRILWPLAFLLLGGITTWLVLKDVDLENTKEQLASANFFWLIPVLLCTVLGHVARAFRWRQFLGKPVPIKFLLMSIWNGYFVNLAIPRGGEITKATTLHKLSKVHWARIGGTIVTERILDVASLAFCVLVGLSIQHEEIKAFYEANIGPSVESLSTQFFVLGSAIGLAGLAITVLLVRKWLSSKSEWLVQLAEGLKGALFVLKSPSFYAYTTFIWLCYIGTSYFCLFAFDSTSHLGFAHGWVIMAVGSIARLTPIQAGAFGVFHAAIATLMLSYGIQYESGLSYAVLNHGSQIGSQLVLGIVSTFLVARWLRPTQLTSSK